MASLLLAAAFAGQGRVSPPSDPPSATIPSLAADLPQWQDLKRRSDWAALELSSRSALADLQSRGASAADVATAMVWLADAVQGQGRYADAEPLYRRALALRQKALGPNDPETVAGMEDLGLVLMAEGRYGEAEPLIRRALAISAAAFGEGDPRLARGENIFARLLRDRGDYAGAEPHFRRALAIREKALGPNSPETATSLNNLGLLLWSEGRLDEAEQQMRRSLAIRESVLGPDDPDTGLSLNGLALVLHSQGRLAEAEPLYRRALAVTEKARGPDHPAVALILSNLGGLLSDEGRNADGAPIFRRALSIRSAALGPEHPDTAMSLNNLAFVLEAEGQHAEAEALYRRALSIDRQVLGERHPDTAIVWQSIGELFDDQGRYGEAEPLFRRAVAVDVKALGRGHPNTADALQELAYAEEHQARFEEAAVDYRSACSASLGAGAREQIGEAAAKAKFRSSKCSMRLALSLRGWAEQRDGRRRHGWSDRLKGEAFVAAQRAALSAAGEAMARSAALAAARSAGVGDLATAYESALVERDALDQQFAKAAAEPGVVGVEHRAMLARAHAGIVGRVDALASELRLKAPRYWDLRSPQPIELSSLQARTGSDAALLARNEALLLFLTPPGPDRGIVFAVSKTRSAWARIPLTGDALEAKVRALRTPVERNYKNFDRKAAFELYQSILGDPEIQAVIEDKPVLLFVPAGPLVSLPPGLLVVRPPTGGAAGDSDQDALRATPWLLRSKGLALLPTVSSLRTLRELSPSGRGEASDPLLAFADPDFVGAGVVPAGAARATPSTPPRGFASYYNVGHAIAEALHGLPPLPGTLIEGEALMSALDGRPGSLLTGSKASKAELMARNADGRLAKVRVLEFATHGFVAGSATWLTEPALALAAGRKPEDELLLASEASTLRLNADWVLLSACNTASPDAPEAEGLSGLSRAFFFAGARTLLVSHWRVRDDVAARLVPAILVAERDDPGLSRAIALQKASLEILDDPLIHGAHPSAWATFTLVGEPER